MKKTILFAFVLLGLTSCVTKKSFTSLQNEHMSLKKDVVELEAVKLEKEKLEERFKKLNADQITNTEKLNVANENIKGLLQENRVLLGKYDGLLEQNKSVLNVSSNEKEELSSQLIKQQKELAQKEILLKSLEIDLKNKAAALQKSNGTLEEREKRINELERNIAAQSKKAADLRWKLSQTLQGFSASDLSVKQQDGKVYVSLSQNLLFASGSDKIDPKGVTALKQLASVLSTNTDLEIMVEGHTDNTGTAVPNWDLSTNRALAVVKVLTSNKVEPSKITAAGRGMFMPIADNATPQGKAQNRRTEIILSPKLDELYKILNDK